jgi:CRISPR-associated helicase Cas3
MGEGKTEAALAAVEVLAARFGAGGCFVALPTMATGNAMLPRLLKWLRRLPADAGLPVERSVLLAHSKAALNEEFADLMRSSRRTVAAVDLDGADQVWRPVGDVRSGSAGLVAHQWLRGRKKGMLASFVVGTIDQLLFAGLKSRHLALRHLALAGKVVVIDEVHAYDAYMNTYLDRVLSWLGAYRVPVVMLSATLPARRRRELAEAYAGGSAGADCAGLESVRGYPLITTVVPGVAACAVPVAASGRRTDVQVEQLDDDLVVLADRLGAELAGGGCALVVRNTVSRVLETAAFLRDRFGAGAVTVAHARFLDLDRAANDAGLLDLFGPPQSGGGARPVGPHIVVASQVAEQSLDVDFDLLVSDLCPVDLLLQRMGRLHRHVRERPDRLRVARCLVSGVDWAAVPPEPVRGSQIVYGRYPLLRSLAALLPHVGRPVRLPEDISGLVERAYGPEVIAPGSWTEAMDAARVGHENHLQAQQNKAEAFRLDVVRRDGRPLYGWVQAGVGDADDTRAGRAQVRDSQETIEVLVVQRRADGVLTTVPWLDRGRGGLEVPVDAVPPARVAQIVAASGLRLPVAFAGGATADRAIAELERLCVPAWQAKESFWLAGELILVLDEDCRTPLAEYELRYSPTDGLEVTRAATH